MIEKLTPQQIQKFPFYVDKWTRIGLDNSEVNTISTEQAINKLYECGGLKAPGRIVYCDSPLSMYLTIEVLKKIKQDDFKSLKISVSDSVWDSVRASVWDSVRASVSDSVSDSVWDSVSDSVWDSVWDSVRASVSDSVSDSVRDSVRASVWDSVRASVRASVWDSVRASVSDSVWASVRASVFGQHEAFWLAFYDYFINECEITSLKEKLEGLFAVANECHWLYPAKEICFVSRKPVELNLKNGKLHADGKAAVAYRDGFQIFALNGVRVSEEIAATPAEQLSAGLIVSEKNAEIRAEIVKKIGLVRVMHDLGAEVIDEAEFSNETGTHSYQLLHLQIDGDRQRPFLKMNNPSIEEIHIEGVAPSIRTVREAIMFRNNLSPNQIDDVGGADYYQQGDVLFFPLGAVKVKLFPKFLT